MEGYADPKAFYGINVYFYPEGCVEENITWSVSDESIVRIGNLGNTYSEFNLMSPGTATITATTASGLTATCPVTVYGYENLNLDTPFTYSHTESGNKLYTFTPTEDGTYQLTVRYNSYISHTYLSDIYYDSENNSPEYITSKGEYKDDEDGNFLYYERIYQYKLVKDKTYYINICHENHGYDTDYTITLTKPEPATSLKMNLTSIDGFEGEEYHIYNIFSPENCAYENVTYTSSNEAVAYVWSGDESFIRLVSPGTATITATSESGLTATCEVTVNEAEELSLGLSETYTFTYNNTQDVYKFIPEEDGVYAFALNDQDHSNHYLYMSVKNSNGGYLFSQDGTWIPATQAKLYKGETYYINISTDSNYEDLKAEYFINITKPAPATSMTLNYESITVYGNSTVSLYPIFSPEGSAFEDVKWSIDNEEIAYFEHLNSSSAEVYVHESGTVTVTATSENGLTASCVITVKSISEAPVINVEEKTTVSTETNNAYYKFIPEESGRYAFTSYGDVYTHGIIYDSNLVEVMSNEYGGEDNNFYMEYDFTAGETYYLRSRLYDYYDNAEAYDIIIKKLVPAKSVRKVNGSSLTASVYENVRLITLISPDNAIKEELSWSIDNQDVCYINNYYDDGIAIYTTQAGIATVTVTTESGLTDSIVITVKDNTAPEYIKIYEGESYEGTVGGYRYFNVDFHPDGTEENVYWTSDNPSVVRMDPYGTAYFDAVGTATITVTTESGLTASCKITVTKPANTIEPNETKTVKINSPDEEVKFIFTPEKDGYYSFYSISNEDTYGYIYGETHSDDCDGNKNFKIDYYLNAGQTYQLIASYYSEYKTGEFQVRFERIDENSITGDLDRDGSLGATDLTLLRYAMLGTLPLSGHLTDTYDVNTDNQVNIKDLVRLKKLIAGIEIETDTEEKLSQAYGTYTYAAVGGMTSPDDISQSDMLTVFTLNFVSNNGSDCGLEFSEYIKATVLYDLYGKETYESVEDMIAAESPEYLYEYNGETYIANAGDGDSLSGLVVDEASISFSTYWFEGTTIKMTYSCENEVHSFTAEHDYEGSIINNGVFIRE